MHRIAALFVLLLGTNVVALNASPTPATFRIAGVVVDSLTGQPLDGAEVTIAPVTALDQGQTFLTSADGRFVFANLPAGKYRLTAGRRGYANQGFHQHEGYMTAIVAGAGQDSEHIRFALSPNAVLAGIVTDEAGEPVRAAKVLLFQQSMFDGSKTLRNISQTLTDDQGRYRFAHLLSGTYAVAVYARPWYTQDPASLQILEQLRQLPPTLGRLVESDSSEGSIVADSEEKLQPSLGQLFDVVYPVTFFPGATRLTDAARLSLAPGATEIADFQLRTVPSLHLRVNVALVPATRIISDEGDSQETQPEPPNQAESSADVAATLHIGEGYTDQLQPTITGIAPGVIELSGIPPGEVELLATSFLNPSDGSYVSRSKTVDLSGDADVDLSSQGAPVDVSGVVLWNQLSDAVPSGGPPAPDQPAVEEAPSNLTISFRSLQSGESYDASISSKGKFSFAHSALPAGSYEVEVVAQGDIRVSSIEATGAKVSGRTVEIPVDQPVSLVVHTMEAKCTVSGFALRNGKPVAGAMILLVPQDSGRAGPAYHRDQSDSDGSFLMSPLFPGRYTLLAIENGWDLEWADPAVLFRYLPNGQSIEIPAGGSVARNAKVQ